MSLGARVRRDGGAWLVGLALLVAGGLKVGRPLAFARAVDAFQLLPGGAVAFVAVTLPWLEVLTGALLLAGPWRRGAATVALGLSLGFGGAIVAVLARGLDVACGCFGAWSGPVGWHTLALEIGLVAAAAWAWRTAPQSPPSCVPS